MTKWNGVPTTGMYVPLQHSMPCYWLSFSVFYVASKGGLLWIGDAYRTGKINYVQPWLSSYDFISGVIW